MKAEFRATCPQDSTAVAAFLQRIFDIDPGLPLIEPRHLYWKCWEQHPDWPGSRGYMIAKDNEIVAHGAVVPLVCISGQQRLKVVHLIDWAAEPASVGSGVILLNRILRMVDAVLVVGGSQMTQKALPALGAKLCGEVTSFVRPVRPLRRFAGQDLGLRTAAQVGRSLLWSLQAPSIATAGWTATRIAGDRLASAGIPWPHGSPGVASFARTAETMAYFLKCPAAPMSLYSVAREGSTRGYFLLAHAPGQARIVDFHVDSDAPEDWRILIQLAVSQSLRDYPTVAEVVSMSSEPVSRQALAGSGFHARGDCPLRLLPAKGVALPTEPVRFSMIDSDAAYLHENQPSYLA